MSSRKQVAVMSDSNPHTMYDVTVATDTGRAVACSCKAGQNNRECKHLERAMLMPDFNAARAYFETEGLTKAVFFAKFRLTVNKYKDAGLGRLAVNAAIKRTIRAAERRKQSKEQNP